jgi:hypothetical protein
VNPQRVDIHPSVVLLCLVAKLLLKVQPSLLAHTLWLSGGGIGMVQALVHPPEGERPLGLASYLSVEGLSPRWAEFVDRGIHPFPWRLIYYHGDHGNYVCSCGRVPMSGIDGLETDTQELLCQARMGVYCYVLSCQAINGAASQ